MWPFPAPTERKSETEQLRALGDRIAAIERELRTVGVEWSEWYDKFRLLYARIAKRVEREEKLQKGPQETPPDTNGDLPGVGAPRGLRRSLRGF